MGSNPTKAQHRGLSWYLSLPVFCLMLTIASHAQVATATLGGTVTDPSGAVVIGATVTLQNVETGIRTVTRTNATGVYSIRDIEPGVYSLEVTKAGFATDKPPSHGELHR